jgi:hypothetical protein
MNTQKDFRSLIYLNLFFFLVAILLNTSVLAEESATSTTTLTTTPVTISSGKNLAELPEWLKIFFGQLQFHPSMNVPEGIQAVLVALGFPPELTTTWINFILYILFPLILFTIIVHDILFTGIETLLPTFSQYPRMGWILAFFMVLALVPLKIVGPLLLWIYLNAASFALYGAAMVLVLMVITKIMSGISHWIGSTTKGKLGRFLFLIAILVVFFFPGWYGVWLSIGIYIVLLIGTALVMGILGRFSPKVAAKKEVKEIKEEVKTTKTNIEEAKRLLKDFFVGKTSNEIVPALSQKIHWKIHDLLRGTPFEGDALSMAQTFDRAVSQSWSMGYNEGLSLARELFQKLGGV